MEFKTLPLEGFLTEDIEFLVAKKEDESQKFLFLVKFKHRSYKDCAWIGYKTLMSAKNGDTLAQQFAQQKTIPYNKTNYYNPNFNIIDKILEHNRFGYLVKWKDLPYDEATYEEDIPKEILDKQENVINRTYSTKKGYNQLSPYVNFITNESEFDINFSNQEIVVINNFIECFNNRSTIMMSISQTFFHPRCFLSFCEYLSQKYLIQGPFLVLLHSHEVQEWSTILDESQNLTVVEYIGKPENRDIITKYMMKCNELQFHILISTPEIFINDFSKFRKINWAFAFLTDNGEEYHRNIKYHCAVINKKESNTENSKLISDLLRFCRTTSLKEREDVQLNRIENQFQLIYQPTKEQNQIIQKSIVKYISCSLTDLQKSVIINTLVGHIYDVRRKDFLMLKNKICRIVQHPYIIPGIEANCSINPMVASSKTCVIMKYIQDHVKNKQNLTIVSHYDILLDILQDFIEENGLTPNREVVKKGISLITTKNPDFLDELEKADTIIFYDTNIYQNFKKRKKLIQLLVDSIGEQNWKLWDDETICKVAIVNALQDFGQISSDELDSPKKIPSYVFQLIQFEDFWDNKSDMERRHLPNEQENITKLNVRQTNQLIRYIFSVGWYNWFNITFMSGIYLPTETLKEVSQTILYNVYSLSKKQENYPLVQQILDSNPQKNNSPLIQITDITKKNLEEIADYLLTTFTQLRFFNALDDNGIKRLADHQISKASGIKWWTNEYTEALIKGIKMYGCNGFDYFSLLIDPKLKHIVEQLSDRAEIMDIMQVIMERVKLFVTNEAVAATFFVSENLKEKWSMNQLKSVTKVLYDRGVIHESYIDLRSMFDYEFNENDYKVLVQDMLNNAQKNLQNTALNGPAIELINTIALMKDLHIILTSCQSDLRLLEILGSAPKWDIMTAKFTPNHELQFINLIYIQGIKALNEIIKNPKFADCYKRKTPESLSKTITLLYRYDGLASLVKESVEKYKQPQTQQTQKTPNENEEILYNDEIPLIPYNSLQLMSRKTLSDLPQQFQPQVKKYLSNPQEYGKWYEEQIKLLKTKQEEQKRNKKTAKPIVKMIPLPDNFAPPPNASLQEQFESIKKSVQALVDQIPVINSNNQAGPYKPRRPRKNRGNQISSKEEINEAIKEINKQFFPELLAREQRENEENQKSSKTAEIHIDEENTNIVEDAIVSDHDDIPFNDDVFEDENLHNKIENNHEDQNDDNNSAEQSKEQHIDEDKQIDDDDEIDQMQNDDVSLESHENHNDESDEENNQEDQQHTEDESDQSQHDISSEENSESHQESQSSEIVSSSSDNDDNHSGDSAVEISLDNHNEKAQDENQNDDDPMMFPDLSPIPNENNEMDSYKFTEKEEESNIFDEQQNDREKDKENSAPISVPLFRIDEATSVQPNNENQNNQIEEQNNENLQVSASENALKKMIKKETKNAIKDLIENEIASLNEEIIQTVSKVLNKRFEIFKKTIVERVHQKVVNKLSNSIINETSSETSDIDEKPNERKRKVMRTRRTNRRKIYYMDSPDESESDNEYTKPKNPVKENKKEKTVKKTPSNYNDTSCSDNFGETAKYFSEDSEAEELSLTHKKRSGSTKKYISDVHQDLQDDNCILAISGGISKVLSLGRIVWDRPNFHTERYVYPDGYKVSRMYKSMTTPGATSLYICEIIDTGDDSPIFRVSSDGISFEGFTASNPWSMVLQKINKVNNTSRTLCVSGPEMFLLTNPAVQKMLFTLPNIEKCTKLIIPNL